MIAALRRAFAAALTPPPPPENAPDGKVPVRSYTRRKPTNAKREALHAQLRAELGR